MNNIFQNTALCIGSIILWAVCNALFAATSNVHYSGKLVGGACSLVVDNDTMATVDFHTITSGSFDANGQSIHIPFTLNLKDCKTALANGVQVSFMGAEDSNLPGMLALDPSSVASGFAIGIETTAQQLIPINALQGTIFEVKEGVTDINLKAWLQKYAVGKLISGDFVSNVTITFEYL